MKSCLARKISSTAGFTTTTRYSGSFWAMRKKARLRWSDRAVRAIQRIKAEIAKDKPRASSNQVRRIRNKASLLRTLPELGGQVEELPYLQLRELIEGNYRIIYSYDG